MKRKNTPAHVLTVILLLFFMAFVIVPVIRMFTFIGGTDVLGLVSEPRFRAALGHSVLVTLTSAFISVGVAFVLSVSIERSQMKGKNFWIMLLTLPMLIPSISHGMGLIVLCRQNGVITRFFHMEAGLYGFWGIVAGSVMYSFPVAFLMISNILRYEDHAPYEAAAVLGLGRARRFLAIGLPYLSRPLMSVVFVVFTMTITDYGVPLAVGGQYITLPVIMYQDVIGMLDFGKGSVIGVFLLIPALISFLFDITGKEQKNMNYVRRPFEPRPFLPRDLLATVFCAVAGIAVLLPVGAFGVLAFTKKYPVNMSVTLDNWYRVFRENGGVMLRNSLVIALCTAVLGIVVSFTVAYLTARLRGKGTRVLHLFTITSLAIPGLVLGLSYVLTYKGSAIYGTVIILVMVNLVHFIASPYLMIYNTLGKLNENLEAVGATLGVSRLSVVFGIIIPRVRVTLIEMFSYFFVNAMMTISAVSFLARRSTGPVALKLNEYESSMLIECSAVIALLILTCNLMVKAVAAIIKKIEGAKC